MKKIIKRYITKNNVMAFFIVLSISINIRLYKQKELAKDIAIYLIQESEDYDATIKRLINMEGVTFTIKKDSIK